MIMRYLLMLLSSINAAGPFLFLHADMCSGAPQPWKIQTVLLLSSPCLVYEAQPLSLQRSFSHLEAMSAACRAAGKARKAVTLLVLFIRLNALLLQLFSHRSVVHSAQSGWQKLRSSSRPGNRSHAIPSMTRQCRPPKRCEGGHTEEGEVAPVYRKAG